MNANHPFRSWAKPQAIAGAAKDIAESLPETAWRRLPSGDGTKGERLHDWAYLELADLDAGDYDDAFAGLWTRGLLIRRNIADGDIAFFSTWCPKAYAGYLRRTPFCLNPRLYFEQLSCSDPS